MKKYVAIGHWYNNNNTTCFVGEADSIAEFRTDLKCNGFRVYVVLSDRKLAECKNANEFEIFEIIKKLTTNYRKWNEVVDYVEQCMGTIEYKFSRI